MSLKRLTLRNNEARWRVIAAYRGSFQLCTLDHSPICSVTIGEAVSSKGLVRSANENG